MDAILPQVRVEGVSESEYSVGYDVAADRFVQYLVWHDEDERTNKESWRIRGVNVIADDLVLSPFREGSQWEYAFRPQGAPDFMGGLHGDENVVSVAFYADGAPVGSTFLARGRSVLCQEWEMRQHTELFDPRDGESKAGDMHVRHTFSAEGLRLSFRFLWAKSLIMEASYAGMCPVIRGEEASTKCRFLGQNHVHDISRESHHRPGQNASGIELWNDRNALTVRVVLDEPAWFNGFKNSMGCGIFVSEAPQYNKVYPARIVKGATEHVEVGDVWVCSALYGIAF